MSCRREIANFSAYGDRGEVWFGQQSAKLMLSYLRQHYPALSYPSTASLGPFILDLGTGNGHLLFSLCCVRDEKEEEEEDDDEDEERKDSLIATPDRLCGVDYSSASIQLCQKIASAATAPAGVNIGDIAWKVLDMLNCAAVSQVGQFDILLDKGTFDAIALASCAVGVAESEEKADSHNWSQSTPLETYISNLAPLSAPSPDSLLLITSCNFTAQELIARIHAASQGAWKHHETLPPKKEFSFGGQKGSTTCCVAFKRNL